MHGMEITKLENVCRAKCFWKIIVNIVTIAMLVILVIQVAIGTVMI
jgi:hypothetical protein